MGSVESDLNAGRGLPQTTTTTNTTSVFPQRYLNEFVLFTTLAIVLLAGLNLLTASLFEDQVNHEQNTGKLQFDFNLGVLLGILMIVYSVGGLILNCQNKLPGKYIPCLIANISITLIGFGLTANGDTVNVPEAVDIKHEKLSNC